VPGQRVNRTEGVMATSSVHRRPAPATGRIAHEGSYVIAN
jgi:hypothetical protein